MAAWFPALSHVVIPGGRVSAFYKAVYKFVDAPRLNIMFSLQRMLNKSNLSSVSQVQNIHLEFT